MVYFFTLTISWTSYRSFSPEGKAQRLNLIGLLGGFIDILENVI
jgi:hypothetical protein